MSERIGKKLYSRCYENVAAFVLTEKCRGRVLVIYKWISRFQLRSLCKVSP